MSKRIDIFIKSYSKDFWMLQIALKTITRNVTGYDNVILIIPEHEKELFDTRGMPDRTLIHYVKEEGPGWLFQQWCKINAASYSDIVLRELPILKEDGMTIFSRYDYTEDMNDNKMFVHGFDVFFIPHNILHIFLRQFTVLELLGMTSIRHFIAY